MKKYETANVSQPDSCEALLNKFKTADIKKSDGELLSFDIAKNHHFEDQNDQATLRLLKKAVTIYNPTKPIIRDNKRYIFGRVEPLKSERSKIMFFEESSDGVWRVVDEAPVLGLQDPFFVENVQGFHIIGGVKTSKVKGKLSYRTVFYCYRENILELLDKNGMVIEPFAAGPEGMKDIRLIGLKDGRIAVFTRPQGGGAGLGKIGYIEIDSLDELSEKIPMARIIENQFLDTEWGGANELHLLDDGRIGVLGHIAHFEGELRHYYAMSFIYDPVNHNASPIEILTTADDFPLVASKKPDLGKIIFSGGLHRHNDGTADLYVGVGDVTAGKIRIKDPFTSL